MIEILMIVGTIVVFFLTKKLNARYTTPFLFPVLTSTIILVILLKTFSFSYDEYMSGAKWIDAILGPAVVSFAYPLYMQRELIKKHLFSIITSVIVAMVSGVLSIFVLAKLVGTERDIIASLLAKSITTPVATSITVSLDGIPSLTAVFVILAGLTGAIIGPIFLRLFKINNAISIGIAMGSASHGIGVSKLSEYGEQTLSMGSVGMTLSAVTGSFLCPLFAMFLL